MVKKFITVSMLLFVLFGASQAQEEPGRAEFLAGVEHVKAGDLDAARASFERSIELDGEQPASYRNLGSVLLQLGEWSFAESAFRNAIRRSPDMPDIYTDLCMALSNQGKHPPAIEACEESVKRDPNSPRAVHARLNALRASGVATSQMVTFIEQAIDRFRSNEAILVMAAQYYLEIRNLQQAAFLLENLRSIQPGSATYAGILAETYLRMGRDAEALALAREALKVEPLNSYGNYAIGMLFYELGQHLEAIEAFQKVDPVVDRYRDAQFMLSQSLTLTGKPADAAPILSQLSAQYPTNVQYLLTYAETLSKLNRYSDAANAYMQADKIQPNDLQTLSGLGMSYMMRGQHEEALEYFERGQKIRPADEIINMFVNVARGRRNLVPQIPDMIAKVNAAPDNIRLRLDLARTLLFAHQVELAKVQVEKIFAADTTSHEAYSVLAVALAEAGEIELALTAYERSNAIEPNPTAYLGLAGIYGRRGQFERSAAAYEKIFTHKPDAPGILIMYGNLLRDNGKRREALEVYKRSLSFQPNGAVALFNAGILSLKLGERDAAINYLGTLERIDPQSAAMLRRCIELRIWG